MLYRACPKVLISTLLVSLLLIIKVSAELSKGWEMSLNLVLLRGFNTQLAAQESSLSCEYVDDAQLACGKNQVCSKKRPQTLTQSPASGCGYPSLSFNAVLMNAHIHTIQITPTIR